jgi:hypothetical protein
LWKDRKGALGWGGRGGGGGGRDKEERPSERGSFILENGVQITVKTAATLEFLDSKFKFSVPGFLGWK